MEAIRMRNGKPEAKKPEVKKPEVKKIVPVVKKTVIVPETKKQETKLPEVKKPVVTTKPEATAKPKVEPKVKKEKVQKEPRPLGFTGFMVNMLVQHKFTDEEIIAATQKAYPSTNIKSIKMNTSIQRADINAGRKPKWLTVAGKPIERLMRDASGKLVPYVKTVKEKPAKVKKEKPLLANLLKDETDTNGMPETHKSK